MVWKPCGKLVCLPACGIDKYGGSINKFLGDGLMAIFGTPFSHEDDPERAARASLEIIKSIEENGKIKRATLEILAGSNNVGEKILIRE